MAGGTVADTARPRLRRAGHRPGRRRCGRWPIRGVARSTTEDDSLWLWTLRGAPHVYRRSDLASVAPPSRPFSDADAGKRIFDASKPLKAAGIGNLEALDEVAAQMRTIVDEADGQGRRVDPADRVMPEPYLRWCNPCQATHLHEMPFRLAAVRAGLELQPDTSPPVLQRIARLRAAGAPGARAGPQLDAVRTSGSARAVDAAAGGRRSSTRRSTTSRRAGPTTSSRSSLGGRAALAAGRRRGAAGRRAAGHRLTRLLGPYDLYLQGKDRPLLVDDRAHAKALWPVIGRPGAVLVDGEVAGSWRPRTKGGQSCGSRSCSGRRSVRGRPDSVADQAERLAAYRGVGLAGVDID